MHRSELRDGRLGNVNIERLALVDKGASVHGHINDALLWNFPHGPIKVPYVFRNLGYIRN